MDTSFIAGVLAYALATFNGGYLWHIVLFNDMYVALKVYTRLDDVAIPLGAAAVGIQFASLPVSVIEELRYVPLAAKALLVSYMLPVFHRATGRSGPLSGAIFGLWMAGLMFSVGVLAHSAKNRSACVEGFVVLEGIYCLLQFPLSCAVAAFSQGRAAGARREVPPEPARLKAA